MVRGSFEEILSTGDRHRCDMTVCACVLSRLKSIESSLEDGAAAAVNVTVSSQRGKDQLQLLLSEIKEKDKKLKIQEEKITDLQEDNLQQIKKSQSEIAGQKQGYEH